MCMQRYSLVIVSVNEPLLAGMYTKNISSSNPESEGMELQETYRFYGHTTHALNELFSTLFAKGVEIEYIYYARGPGRFSALKSTHIYLHTLALTKGYRLYSTSSFAFNNANPIHAFANKYFVLRDDEILLETECEAVEFRLPKVLYPKDFSCDNTPLYILPAV